MKEPTIAELKQMQKDAHMALGFLEGLLKGYTPKHFWQGDILSPMKRYVQALEVIVEKKHVQASFVIHEELENDDQRKL